MQELALGVHPKFQDLAAQLHTNSICCLQVVAILLAWLECHNWHDALERVVPSRKRALCEDAHPLAVRGQKHAKATLPDTALTQDGEGIPAQ